MPPKKSPKKTGKKKSTKQEPTVIKTVEAKPPAHSEAKNSLLLFTIANSDRQSMARLVSHYGFGEVLTTVDINGSTPVHIAVRKNDTRILQDLVSHNKINLNTLEYKAVGGYSALHHACLNSFHSAMSILLEAGANPNVKCDSVNGETPLQIACRLGDVRSGRILLNHGASPEIKDNFGNNASFWAYKYHNDAFSRELELPPVKTPSAQDFIALLIQKNPRFQLPAVKAAKKKSTKKKK